MKNDKSNFIGTTLAVTLLSWLLPTWSLAFTLLYSTSSSLTTAGWKKNALTIDYDWSQCPAGVSTSSLLAALNAGISIWNGAPSSDLTLSVGSQVSTSYATLYNQVANTGTVTNGTIFCDSNFATDFSIDGTFANGATQDYWDSSGKNYTGFIGLNADSGQNGNIQNLSQNSLNILVAHEIGHFIGLGHSPEQQALMYYDQASKTSLNLSEDDLDGLTYLYPRQEPSTGNFFGCGSLAVVQSMRSNRKPPRKGGGFFGPGDGGAAAETGLLFSVLTAIWLLSRGQGQRRGKTLVSC